VKVTILPSLQASVFPRRRRDWNFLSAHLLSHEMSPTDAELAMDAAQTEDRVDPMPRDLPRCH
jgi:hypothetical protein